MPLVFAAQAAGPDGTTNGASSIMAYASNGRNTQPDKTYLTSDGKYAGAKYGGRLFKTAQENHIYTKIGGGGFAWAREVYDQAKRDGCTMAVVKRTATGDTYTASFEVIDHYGVPRNHAGWGAQIVLPFRFWRINGQPSEAEKDAERIAANNSQLSLFGGVA